MLHRLALRVIPQLNAVVTASDVRKRKRWAMLVPGLVAFALYHLLKNVLPISDPFVLLAMSGVFATLTSVWAYTTGRTASFVPTSLVQVCRADGLSRLLWVGGWIGCVYGVQLSLLVLALLALFVQYDFLLHPEGPAMMALIISCTAVTRDAFEIGHVVRMESSGTRMVTFPDGGSFRELLRRDGVHLAGWAGMGFVVGGAAAAVFRLGWPVDWITGGRDIGQALLVCVVAACFAYGAFVSGKYPLEHGWDRLTRQSWWEAGRFWLWPCLTFALTYYLVQIGLVRFVLPVEGESLFVHPVIGGVTAGMMAGYGYFLGARVFVETQTHGGVSEGVMRCPFVMEILAKTGWASASQRPAPMTVGQGQPDQPRELLS